VGRSLQTGKNLTENSIQAVERMVREKQTNHSVRHYGGFKYQSWFIMFHLTLRGRKFSSDEEVIGSVQNWLETQPKNFFSDGIKKKLVKSWNWCIEVEGDYMLLLKSSFTFCLTLV
jgi:hypothetical protein